MRRYLWLVLPCVLLAGCSTVRTLPLETEPGTGKPVLLWKEYRELKEAQTFDGDYALVMVWNQREQRFCLYDRPRGVVQVTEDLEALLGLVGELPEGIAVARFTTCGGGFDYDMPAGMAERVERELRAGRRTRGTPREGSESGLICTCETTGLRFPGR